MLFSLLLTTADIMVFWSGYRIHERLLKVNVRRRRRREPIKDGKKKRKKRRFEDTTLLRGFISGEI